MRKGVYHASYICETLEDAVALVAGMSESVASSFGDDEDESQWEGIDLSDPGAIVTILTGPPGVRTRYTDVRVEVRIPVDCVPPKYWLSPFEEMPRTFDRNGKSLRGEPHDWGMTFRQGQGRKS